MSGAPLSEAEIAAMLADANDHRVAFGSPAQICAHVEALADEVTRLRAERDAYKRAKTENDDRFMTERDAARAIADKYMNKAEQLASDKGIAETREAAARADLAKAVELIQECTSGPVYVDLVMAEKMRAFLATQEPRR
jgi:hypothetical protein